MKYIISHCLLFFSLAVQAQQPDREASIQKVLKKNIPGKLFIFGKWSETGGEEYHLKYLGQVKTRHGKVYKFVNLIFHFAYSHRATSSLLIYNHRDQFVGRYIITHMDDLPDQLWKGHLIFTHYYDRDDCDKKLVTWVNVSWGLPKLIFQKCKGEYGDIYDFAGG